MNDRDEPHFLSEEINPEYNDPDSYSKSEAYKPGSNLPPDWENRCRLVWSRQDNKCERCGRDRNEAGGHVHHINLLSHGGSNSLDNLVGLCMDCHALMHPDIHELDGFPTDAPIFPVSGSESKVAVVRKPKNHDNLSEEIQTQYFTKLLPRRGVIGKRQTVS